MSKSMSQEDFEALKLQYPGFRNHELNDEGKMVKKGKNVQKEDRAPLPRADNTSGEKRLAESFEPKFTMSRKIENKLQKKEENPGLDGFGGSLVSRKNAEDAARQEAIKRHMKTTVTPFMPEKPPMTPSQVDVPGETEAEAATIGSITEQENKRKMDQLFGRNTPSLERFGEKFAAKQPSPESMDRSGFEGTTNQRSEKPPVSRKQARQDRRQARRNRRAQRRAGRK